jgi:hypothetical protein
VGVKISVADSAVAALSHGYNMCKMGGYDCVAQVVYVDSNEYADISDSYWTIAYFERATIDNVETIESRGFQIAVDLKSLPKGTDRITVYSRDAVTAMVSFDGEPT